MATKKSSKVWEYFEKVMPLASDEDEEEQDGTGEMKAYLKDFTKCNGGPLEWWQKNEDRYPKLSRAARRLHSIPSTSTPSERIFSKAGFIANKSRSAPFPTSVNKLVFHTTSDIM